MEKNTHMYVSRVSYLTPALGNAPALPLQQQRSRPRTALSDLTGIFVYATDQLTFHIRAKVTQLS